MKNIAILILFLICLVSNAFAQQRIIGGYTVNISERPFQAFIACEGKKDTFNVGGGGIISPQWILTAAHVVTDETGNIYPINKVYVTTGTTSINYFRGDPVSEIIVHPDYIGKGNNYENDIALVKLRYPLSWSSVRQAVMMSNIPYVISGTKGIVSGWGKTSINAETIDRTQLRATEVTISSSSGKKIEVAASTSVSYKGDSGGPLTIEDPLYGTILVGLVSYGIVNATTTQPSYYTNVGYYFNWIKSKIGMGTVSLTTPYIITKQAGCSLSNLPTGASVHWYIGNNDVVSINNQGLITVKKQGITSIFVDITNTDGTKLILYGRTIIGIPEMYITRYDAVEYPPLNNLSLVTNKEFLFMANPSPVYWDISNIGFNFHWALRNSSGTLVDSRSVYNCGVRVGIFGTTFPSAGTYTLEVEIEKDGVSETYHRTVEAIGGYRATPNPANSQLTIQLTDQMMGYTLHSEDVNQVAAKLYSSSSLVRSVLFNSKEGTTIDVSLLPEGIYYLVIQNKDKVLDRQTVIVKH